MVKQALFYGLFSALYIPKSIDFNLIDSIINIKKTFQLVNDKIVYVISIILYFIAIIVLIVIGLISVFYDYSYIDNLYYEDRTNVPFIKSINQTTSDIPQSFCYSHSNDNFYTDDFAIMTTLPRLYGLSEEGQCFIKPKFRGVFNTTMKYIFGPDYNEQGIRIYCWPKTHDPYLVITTEDSFKNQLNRYPEENISVLPDDNIIKETQSSEHFNDTLHLCDSGMAYSQCISLQTCLNSSESDCDIEWSEFTNAYWKEQTEDYVPNMKGLEQYQITITEDNFIQPRFIYLNYTLLSGIHYIVGGGFENIWGYGSLLENFVRVIIPNFFGEFLPLYDFIHDYFNDMFNMFSEFALTFIYVKSLSTNEIREVGNLIQRFNFSRSNLFLVGHSISGTTIKEMSYISSISGIVFESTKGLNHAKYRVSSDFAIENNNNNKISNIYSSFLSGEDNDFLVNGMLPKYFSNPNVYDTACLTSVTCSTTEKYVPFCQQVLNQHNEDPISNFNDLIQAYQNQ